MQITIEGQAAQRTNGLRVIAQIPHGRLQRLEGQNGIGKTLAMRLLELVTGRQPYRGRPAAWKTLRTGLGELTITFDELRPQDGIGRRLVVRLTDSNTWPQDPLDPGEWLGTAELDGNDMAIVDVSAIVTARRVGGDEALGESLALELAADGERLRQLHRRQDDKRGRWQFEIDKLVRLTQPALSVDLDALRRDEAATRSAHDACAERLQQALRTAEQAAGFQAAIRNRARLTEQQPRIETRLAHLVDDERRILGEIDQLETHTATLLNANRETKRIRTRLDELARLQRLRQERRERRRVELESRCSTAGLPVPVDLLEADAIRRDLDDELHALASQRMSLDRAGLMRELVSEVMRPIERADVSGLGAEVLAQIESGPLTVLQMRRGLTRRREGLPERPSEEASSLLRTMQELQRRQHAAQGIPDAVRLRAKADDDLQATQSEIASLLASLSKADAGSLREANDRRIALVDELAGVLQAKSSLEAELTSLLRHGTDAELKEQIERLAAALAIPTADESTASAAVARYDGLVDEEQRAAALAAHSRDRALEALSAGESTLRSVAHAVTHDAGLAWARRILPIPSSKARPEEFASVIESLHRKALAVRELLIDSLNDLQAVELAIENLQQRLAASATAGNLASTREFAFSTPVRQLYERRFAARLDDDDLRIALFDGGKDITVSLEDMSTSWTGRDGSSQTRPLEAFSSGERAFAYTQVQLQQLSKDATAPNRIVFLDEFGAFVARERLEQLLRYLRHEALESVADQLVLVLPLHDELDANGREELRQRRGYVVREVE